MARSFLSRIGNKLAEIRLIDPTSPTDVLTLTSIDQITAALGDDVPETGQIHHSTRMNFAHVGNDGTFGGYAYLWDAKIDGITIAPGAFLASIEKRWPKLLWDHNPSEPVGKWISLNEDEVGLYVKGQLNMETEKGRELAALMVDRAVDGMSISFTAGELAARGQDESGQKNDIRLDAVVLWEISVVTFPAVENAVVDMNTINLSDQVTIDAASVRRTNDGYLVAYARAARTGVQLYSGAEVGKPDMDVVRVYRPENEVFAADSLRSYGHKPMTNNHPPEAVSPANWSKYATGHVDGEVVRDGQFVKVPLVMMDAQAIKDFEGGKKELSLGYTTDLKFESGKTPAGEAYDAIQTNIRANHLALVSKARGGDQLRIGDNEPRREEPRMNQLSVFKVDSIDCQMDAAAAQIVQRALADRQVIIDSTAEQLKAAKSRVTELEAKLKEEEEKGKKAKDEADAKIATLEKGLKDASDPTLLDQRVKDRASVVDVAKGLLATVVVDGKSETEIRRQVVEANLKDAAKGMSDDSIKVAFDTMVSMAKANGGLAPRGPVHDAFAADLVGGHGHGNQTLVDQAYAKRDDHYANAWRNAGVDTKQ